MSNGPRIKHIVGLDAELGELVERVRRLCEERRGSCVLIYSSRGRGKTALWHEAVKAAKAKAWSPRIVDIDADDLPKAVQEATKTVQDASFLSASPKDIWLSVVRSLGDVAGQLPLPWASGLIIKLAATVPTLTNEVLNIGQADDETAADFAHRLLLELIPKAAGDKPCVLVVENLEGMPPSAIEFVDALARMSMPALPLLLLVTCDASLVRSESRDLLDKLVRDEQAHLMELPPVSKASTRQITGEISDAVLSEIFELSNGSVATLEELWGEVTAEGLVCQGPSGRWEWDVDVDAQHLGAIHENVYSTLDAKLQESIRNGGDEKLVRYALAVAALHDVTFSDEVVANVLWRLGLRLSDAFRRRDANDHVNAVVDFLDDTQEGVVKECGFDKQRSLHVFRSTLFRHFLRCHLPPEARDALCVYTAQALRHVYPDDIEERMWLVIDLLRMGGRDAEARELLDQHTASPSPEGQKWELVRLLDQIRRLHGDEIWAHRALELCETAKYAPIRDCLLAILDQVIQAAEVAGNADLAVEGRLKKGQFFYAWGNYSEALAIANEAAAFVRRNCCIPLSPVLVSTLKGICLLQLAQLRQAEGPLEWAHLEAQEILGPDHPYVATTLNELAGLYQEEGRYKEAEPLLQRALGIDERVLGPGHPDVATTLNNLAVLYLIERRPKEAEPLFQRALAIKERVLGPEHTSLAATVGNLAGLYLIEGRPKEAEPLLQRALGIDERVLGPGHPDVARTLSNLAGLYQQEGRYKEAEPLFQRALAIRERALGLEHPSVAMTLDSLAGLYRAEGRLEKADTLFQRALAIRERVLGPDHPDVDRTASKPAV